MTGATRIDRSAAATSSSPRPAALFVAGMVGAAYAAVPLYNWFCRATGFGGTTAGRDRGARAASLDRTITVRFDANVGPGLPWRFEPEQNAIEVKLGEVVTVNYRVINQAARAITASGGLQCRAAAPPAPTSRRSTASASPSRRLKPGEKREMPVVFYVDPAMAKDPERRRAQHASRCPTRSIRSASRRGRWRIGSDRPDSPSEFETERRADNGRRARQATTTTTSSIRARGRPSARSRPSSWRSARSPGCTTCSRRRRWCSAPA